MNIVTYVITYFLNGMFVSEDTVNDSSEAYDLIRLAINMADEDDDMCDALHFTVMVDDDVCTHTEAFLCDGVWVQVYTNNFLPTIYNTVVGVLS